VNNKAATVQVDSGTKTVPRPEGRLRAHLIKGATGSFILQVGFAGLSFLNAIILARVLGAEGYGAFANAMAWVSLLTIPATFGFGILLVRDVSIYRAQSNWALLKGLLYFADRFVLALSLLLALVAAVVAGWMFSSPTEETMRNTIWVALLLLPILTLNNIREPTIRGLEHVVLARLPGMIVRPGLLLIGIVALYFLPLKHLSAPVVMIINVVAGLVALCLALFFLHRLIPGEVKSARANYTQKLWLKSAFPLLVYGGAQIVMGQTDIIMLGALRGAQDVGLYAVVNRMAFLLIYVTMASNMILMPVMSRLFANGEKQRLQIILTKAVRIAFLLVLPTGLLFIFFGRYILVIFGAEFLSAQPALNILSIGRILDVFVGVGTGAILLTIAGKERTISIVFLYAALMNILLNAALIPRFGILGAAVASMLSLLTAKITLVIKSQSMTGIYVTVLGQHLPLGEKIHRGNP